MSNPAPEQQIDPKNLFYIITPLIALVGTALKVMEAHWSAWAIYITWVLLTLIAVSMILDTGWRAYLQGTIRKSTFTQLYTSATRKPLNWLWNRYCETLPENVGLLTTFRFAQSWKLYDTALLVAVVYPILLLLIWWIAGFDGKLGAVVILEKAPL